MLQWILRNTKGIVNSCNTHTSTERVLFFKLHLLHHFTRRYYYLSLLPYGVTPTIIHSMPFFSPILRMLAILDASMVKMHRRGSSFGHYG